MSEEIDQLNELSMKILIHAGNSRELNFQAINAIEEFDFEKAEALFKKANEEIVSAHKLQTSTLQLEAEGKQIRYSTLFSHAQDTLMNVQSEVYLMKRMTKIFEKINERLLETENKIGKEEKI